jgi:PIN domain nuclease of toxin-antitoxin system
MRTLYAQEQTMRSLRDFHNDPADQIIVATARVLNCLLLTADHKIRRYPHVAIHAIT